MSARLATEVRWNTTVTFIAIRDKIISSKLISYLKMSQMREKAFIILQDTGPHNTVLPLIATAGSRFFEKFVFSVILNFQNQSRNNA